MLDRLQRFAAWLMNSVRVNQITKGIQDGSPVIIKRRRPGGTIVVWFGNWFLALSRSGVSMFIRTDEWVQWEIECARLLYPLRPTGNAGSRSAVIFPEVHGTSLRQFARDAHCGIAPFVAATRELRRAHAIHSPHFNSTWSHGDLHLDNVLVDDRSERAVLIDFDTRHDVGLGATQRHSDDLKVMLLELISQSDEGWSDRASAVISEYADADVLEALDQQLVVPRGLAKILWHYRTNGAPAHVIESRLLRLRAMIQRTISHARVSKNAASSPRGEGEPTCLHNG